MAKRSMQANSFAFFDFLQEFYLNNKGRIRNRYKDLTKKFLDYNDSEKNPHAYLRRPQFEALEMYVFLKEFCGNPQIYDLFDKWFKREGDFADETVYTVSKAGSGQMSLYDVAAVDYKGVFNAMRKNATVYPNYIYALTMGLGKTVLMATCVFYEFLLANKYPNDKRFCHNVLVFAPDKTVLQSLHEIVTMKKELVVPQEYCRVLDQNIKFHFLDDAGITLNTLDNSDFNIIISNTQKIIKKRVHKEKTPIEKLLETGKEVFVHIVACDKLTVIEPGVIIKEHLDAVHNQSLAVAVYGMTQFVLYLVEAVHDDLPFLGAEVQSLVSLVGEKGIVFHHFSQRSIAEQVGMEHQQITCRLEYLTVIFRPESLSGSDEYQRAVLIIVILPAIPQFTTLHIFQKHGIETVIFPSMAQRLHLREVDETYQRMPRFHACPFIIVINCISFKQFTHLVFLLLYYGIIMLDCRKKKR